jgi:hypothetical protein
LHRIADAFFGEAKTMRDVANNLSPLAILDKARKAVPAVNFALGVAGIAAAAALVSLLVGKSNSSIILLSSSFVGMILLFIFSKLVVSTAPSIQFAGVVLVWLVLVFFATFLLFTTTAFVLAWPCNWAEMLGVRADCASSAAQRRGVDPVYSGYSSSELGVSVIYPNNILTLDTTERKQRKLVLRDADGRPVVKITRTAIPEHKNVRLGRENEAGDLARMNVPVTYIAPEKEHNWSNWYVLSGVSHGTEFYFRRWYCEDSVVSMEFMYGKELAPLFDKLIPVMTREFMMSNVAPKLEP